MARVKKKKIIRAKKVYDKKSRVIRISPELDAMLKLIAEKKSEPYDNIIRRILGMEVNKFPNKTAETFYLVLEKDSPVFKEEEEAYGEAIRRAVKRGTRVPLKVMKVRTAI